MKKLLGLLGSVTLVATSVSTAAACSNKLKKVDLTNYLELVSKETYQKHLSIEQAIKSIQAIEQLPAGVSKVDVSKASDDEIKLTFTTAKDYAKVDSLVVKFVPAKVTRITSFNDQAKSLAEYSFKTIKEARDAIATLAPPEGVSSFTATIIDNKIVVTFKMKEGYLPISNQVFQFIAIRDVDTSAFRTKVNEIVNGQFKTVGEAITKIKALSLPTGVASITVSNAGSKITIKFTMKPGYVQVPSQDYTFVAIQDVDLVSFKAAVKEEAEYKYETIDEAINGIKKLSKPVGVRSFNVERLPGSDFIRITFVSEKGYAKPADFVLEFSKIRDANISEFIDKINEMRMHSFVKIEKFVEAVKEMELPEGVAKIDVTSVSDRIIIKFTMEKGYAHIGDKSFVFVPGKQYDISEINRYLDQIRNIIMDNEFTDDESSLADKIKDLDLPDSVATVKIFESKNDYITVTLIFKSGFVGKTMGHAFKTRKTVNWSDFIRKAKDLANEKTYDIHEYFDKINKIPLPKGAIAKFEKKYIEGRIIFYARYIDGYRGPWFLFDIRPKYKLSDN